MMKKAILIIFISFILLGMVLANGSGAIWTTTNGCGEDSPQDENHYLEGDALYLNGENFDEGNYTFDITGLPGQASCHPAQTIIEGSQAVDETGAFCVPIYVIQEDDCGEYKVTFGKKHDNYRVDVPPVVPEFTFVVASATVLGALIAFLIIRK